MTQQLQLGNPLQAGVEGELQPQVIAMHAAGADAIGEGGAITAAADAELQLLAAQLVIQAQFKPGLRRALQVEETEHIGEEVALGIDPLRSMLEINAIDVERFEPCCGGWLQVARQPHA